MLILLIILQRRREKPDTTHLLERVAPSEIRRSSFQTRN